MTTTSREAKNITPRQLEILTFLARGDHSSVGAVAAAMGVSSAAATKAIARLERKGLVTRSIDLMDRRYVKVSVTNMGAALVRR